MDEFDLKTVSRMPLAEGVVWLWRSVLDEALLERIWESHRGRCWTNELTFSSVVQLIHDALLNYDSGRECFQKHRADGTLSASLQAAYGKLRRIPVAVSQALVDEGTQNLLNLFPNGASRKKPASLQGFRIVIYDGKTIKRVAKRLKPCRGVAGGLLGGRVLVALDWETNLATAMVGDRDGDSHDCKHLGELVPVVCKQFKSPRLHICDAGFCDLTQPHHMTRRTGDHFLIRYHPKVKFCPDPSKSQQTSTDEQNQTIIETWGWLGREKDKRRIAVRRIELVRHGADPIILITDLLDPQQYPVGDLLWIYRQRWNIECLFQQVTEVFGLCHLIGCTPEAVLFQFAFCLLLYNMIQVIRGYIAQAQKLEPSAISAEMMFRDVERELISWNVMVPTEVTLEYFQNLPPPAKLKSILRNLFRKTWSETWKASPHQSKHRKSPAQTGRTHKSIYRLLFPTPTAKPASPHQRC